MKIYRDYAPTMLFDLYYGLRTDPLSFQGWSALAIPHTLFNEEERRTAFFDALAEEFPDDDSSLIQCLHNEAYLLTRTCSGSALLDKAMQIYATVAGETLAPHRLTVYDLFKQARLMQDILISHINEHDTPDMAVWDALPLPDELPIDTGVSANDFAQARAERKSRSPYRVLIVEDDAITRRLVSGILKEDHVIIGAANAGEALRAYMMHAPDLVFLDINLPTFSGLDILAHLVKLDPEARIIMFSGNASLANICLSLRQGARGFVPKPFRKERLRHYLHELAFDSNAGLN